MATLQEFARNMDVMAARVVRRASEVKRKTAAVILRDVVMGTPVGNPTLWRRQPAPPGYVGGRARGNWFANLGAASTEVRDVSGAGTGESAMSEGEAVISNATVGQDIHLTNNLPYIKPLNEGSSLQAPAGFVEVAVNNGVNYAAAQKLTEDGRGD